MKRYCFTCDLKDDKEAVETYKKYHRKENERPAITKSIKAAGVRDMQIYLIEKRLFMIMDTDNDFNLEKKKKLDEQIPEVQEWEKLMENFQQVPDFSENGEKWVLMEQIYELPGNEN